MGRGKGKRTHQAARHAVVTSILFEKRLVVLGLLEALERGDRISCHGCEVVFVGDLGWKFCWVWLHDMRVNLGWLHLQGTISGSELADWPVW